MSRKLKENVKENLDVMIDIGTTLLGSMLSDTLVGQVAPGIVTTYLGYKQKRFEKMTNNAIE